MPPMPNLIKKVLANVAQTLTTAEKQQARDHIVTTVWPTAILNEPAPAADS